MAEAAHLSSLESKKLTTKRGFEYQYYISPTDECDPQKPAIVLHHGFPDTAALWDRMLPFLTQLPNRLVIPDLLGYGGTSKPADPAAYAFNLMTQDLLDIMDAENISKVISLGHDHGAGSASHFYNHAPDRTVAMILLNTAYSPPSKDKPFNLDAINALGKSIWGYPTFEYWKFFTSDEAAQIMVENLDRLWEAAHPSTFEGMRDLFGVPGALRQYLTDRSVPSIEIRPYAKDNQLKEEWMTRLRDGGFEAPLCWYQSRVQGVQFESDKSVRDENIKVNVPMLYVGCTEDAVSRREMIKLPKDAGLLPDLTMETLEGVGHWPMLERPQETAEIIIKWVGEKGL